DALPDQCRACLGAIGPPQPQRVRGSEEEDTVDTDERRRAGRVRPRSDVLDEHGALLGPVALPQLAAGLAMEGGEEEGAVDRGEIADPGPLRPPLVDVLDEDGAGLGPVALPQHVT